MTQILEQHWAVKVTDEKGDCYLADDGFGNIFTSLVEGVATAWAGTRGEVIRVEIREVEATP